MADVTLPQLGETVTEGTITQWFKAVGDTVEIDEPLFEVSTDKVDSEVPSPASGVLTEIRVPEGETVDVGTVLAVVGDASDVPSGSDVPASSEMPADPVPPVPPAQAPESPVPPAPPTATASSTSAAASDEAAGRPAPPSASPVGSDDVASGVVASPIVRGLMDDHGIDAATIAGSGPGGRITRADVEAVIETRTSSNPQSARTAPVPATPAPATPAPGAAAHAVPGPDRAPSPPGERDTVEAFNKMRRLTGEHMVHSKAVAPHVLMTHEVDYEAVEIVRRRHGAAFAAEEGFSLSYLPFIVLATVDAIREFPHVNASVGDGSLIVHHDINLGIAVDLHHEGLIVPVMHGADGLRLRAVAREIHALADRARSNQLTIDDITGGSFTISNPGPFGTHFTGAIINQPQVAILSTEGVSRKPVVVTAADGSETIGIHSVGLLAFSFDHRAFDGAYAAAFLAKIKDNIATRDWEVELS